MGAVVWTCIPYLKPRLRLDLCTSSLLLHPLRNCHSQGGPANVHCSSLGCYWPPSASVFLVPSGWAPCHGFPELTLSSLSLLTVCRNSHPQDIMGSHLRLSRGSWLVPRVGLGVAWHCPPLCTAPSLWNLPQPCQQG